MIVQIEKKPNFHIVSTFATQCVPFFIKKKNHFQMNVDTCFIRPREDVRILYINAARFQKESGEIYKKYIHD